MFAEKAKWNTFPIITAVIIIFTVRKILITSGPSEVNRPASVSSKRHDPAASISATSEESILSGTTQDESMLNDFFNPTGTDEKLNDVEFSMTAHVAEFDNRQKAKRAAEQIKKSSSKISGKKEESVADDKSGS